MPSAPAPAGRWSIPVGQPLHIGQISPQGAIVVSAAELPLPALVLTWLDDRAAVQVRATTPGVNPLIDDNPVRHARLKPGQRFKILDTTFEVSGPAQIALVGPPLPSVPPPAPQPTPPMAPPMAPPRTAPPAAPPPNGRQWTIPPGQLLAIGRDDGPADIKLAGLDLTQHHATVSWNGRTVELRSTSPQARPFVNGQPVLHARIPVGGRFMIGNHTLMVSASAEITLLTAQVTAREPLLRFSAVSLKYRGRTEATLKEMSFDLARGEVLAVIGPSGAGKSTMCGGLLGEVGVESGSMALGQVDLSVSRMQASHLVSFVPQQPAMYGNLSVRDSLMWVARLRLASDSGRTARADRVERVLAAMELTNDVDKRVDTLSGGQRKRVSTAMELLSDPLLLVLDEPTSGLDEGLDRKMMDSLRTTAAEGRAVIVVTHSMVNIDRADKILALTGRGRLAYFGPPAELLSTFNARNFAEVMNKLRADDVTSMRPQPTAAPRGGAEALAPSTPTGGSLTRHLPLLIGRELARQRRSFPQLATSLVVGVLLTALLTAAASKTGPSHASGISSMLLPLIVCLTFFSMAQSFSSIVDDRDVIERESRWSISAASMVLARAITCAPIAVILGVASMSLYLLIKNQPPEHAVLPYRATLLMFGTLLPLAAMTMGLLISTVTTSLRQAVFVLMGVLALQVVLTGLAPRFEGTSGWILGSFAVLTVARWAATGLAAEMHIKEVAPGPLPPGAPPPAPCTGTPVPGQSPFCDDNLPWAGVWDADSIHVLGAATVLVVMAILALTLTTWILRRQLLAVR